MVKKEIEEEKEPKNRYVGAILAWFLGGIGIQKFYIGHTGAGILSILFCWTGIPSIIGIIDVVRFLTMTDKKFNKLYN